MTERSQLIELTAEIVASFVSCNPLPAADLPAFISSTYAALAALREPCEQERSHAGAAVPIDESIHDDYLVCLEDGRKLKSLKRHLQHRYGMTPDQYRAKWNLPSDYPMVAPNYAAARSALAKNMGLGQKRRKRA